MSLCDQQSETVKHQIAWTWCTRRWGEGPHRAADLHEDVSGGVILCQPRRPPGGQVGFAREVQVVWFEPGRCLQQQRGSIAPVTCGEGDLGMQQADQGALELVKRA